MSNLTIFDNPIRHVVPSTEVLIKVKEKHIKRGETKDAILCPVSLAIREKVKGTPVVLSKIVMFFSRFDRRHVNIVLGKYRLGTTTLPEKVTTKIKNYEKTGQMAPFEFVMMIPNVALKNNETK